MASIRPNSVETIARLDTFLSPLANVHGEGEVGMVAMGLRSVSIAASAFIGLGVIQAAPAQASAEGCQTLKAFGYSNGGVSIAVPATLVCHKITGSKKRITFQNAYIGGPAAPMVKLCGFRYDWRYYDNNGRLYHTNRGITQNTCKWGSNAIRVDRTAHTVSHYGRACAALYVTGVYRTQQCHAIQE